MKLTHRQLVALLIYGPVVLWIMVVGGLTYATMVLADFNRVFGPPPVVRSGNREQPPLPASEAPTPPRDEGTPEVRTLLSGPGTRHGHPRPRATSLLDEIKFDMIHGAAWVCAVDASLVREVAMRESSLIWQVHPSSGARGYMQIVPRWVRGDAERKWRVGHEAWSNFVEGACRLRRYIDRFGLPAALHAYHGGPTRVMEGTVLVSSVHYADQIMRGSGQ